MLYCCGQTVLFCKLILKKRCTQIDDSDVFVRLIYQYIYMLSALGATFSKSEFGHFKWMGNVHWCKLVQYMFVYQYFGDADLTKRRGFWSLYLHSLIHVIRTVCPCYTRDPWKQKMQFHVEFRNNLFLLLEFQLPSTDILLVIKVIESSFNSAVSQVVHVWRNEGSHV